MEENNKNNLGIIISICLIFLVVIFGYFYRHNKKEQSQTDTSSSAENLGSAEQPKSIDWQDQIGSIRKLLGKSFLDTTPEERGEISIGDKADITGDGVDEALVYIGAGGAYTEYMTLVIYTKGQIGIAEFRHSDGSVSPELFQNGASVRHGEGVKLLPAEKAIYSLSVDRDENGISSCEAQAYRWNKDTDIFDFDADLSQKLSVSSCK